MHIKSFLHALASGFSQLASLCGWHGDELLQCPNKRVLISNGHDQPSLGDNIGAVAHIGRDTWNARCHGLTKYVGRCIAPRRTLAQHIQRTHDIGNVISLADEMEPRLQVIWNQLTQFGVPSLHASAYQKTVHRVVVGSHSYRRAEEACMILHWVQPRHVTHYDSIERKADFCSHAVSDLRLRREFRQIKSIWNHHTPGGTESKCLMLMACCVTGIQQRVNAVREQAIGPNDRSHRAFLGLQSTQRMLDIPGDDRRPRCQATRQPRCQIAVVHPSLHDAGSNAPQQAAKLHELEHHIDFIANTQRVNGHAKSLDTITQHTPIRQRQDVSRGMVREASLQKVEELVLSAAASQTGNHMQCRH